ncbi:MAG: PEP-CTERM sorting domain-containing protein [Pseudomonas sp.]|uniref:PEP-CTERM sorting domain-containing protein n=1 Tax=Pseudomonas sp. TaxID=306 RepID=UPI00121FE252|nr:PEP-CTERM sorting domain-containing protein [Pseudomonas sp.]RZI67059.1 MAG: PEP-CTERM sorting domain-containing protein [Pseudomonas sp.]
MFAHFKILAAASALAVLTPMAAQAAANTFQFYGNGPLTDTVSVAPNYNAGNLGVTVRAFDTTGKSLALAIRFDGLGAFGGGLDTGDIDSLLGGPAEYLELTFSKAVKLNALSFSGWENGLFGPIDQATLSWGNQSLALGTNNDHGLLVKTFDFSGASVPAGTVFKITSTGNLSSFRLAGIGATAVPEPTTMLLMGLGLAGVAFTARRASRPAAC